MPFTDSGKTVQLLRLTGLHVSRADGCMYVNKTSCDFVGSCTEAGDVFIELKGCDVDQGLKQIETTLKDWRAKGWLGRLRAGLIVCTRYPRQDSKIQRARNKFARDFGAPLHVVRHGQSFRFERILAFDGPH